MLQESDEQHRLRVQVGLLLSMQSNSPPRRWVPKVRAGIVHCWCCGRLIPPGSGWDLGYMDNGGRYPEHRSCNRATVTHLKQKLADQEVRRRC